MNVKTTALIITCISFVPMSAHAVNVAGDKLSIYGKVHVSVDYSDNDKASPDDVAGISVSSNSSRIGFKGKYKLTKKIDLFWKMENSIELDQGSGSLATRNSYAGIKGGFGTLLLGHHDTPFKTVGTKWGLFSDTVGDRRALLGASATAGNKMNQRGKNALLYMNKFGDVDLQFMYSPDGQDIDAGEQDNDENDMYSISALFGQGKLSVGIGYENWSNLDTDNNNATIEEVKGLRVAVKYNMGVKTFGVIYETISSDDTPELDRNVVGLNAELKSGKTTFKVQYLSAGDYETVSDSGATMFSVGAFNKLDSRTQTYIIYTATKNDDNAAFQGVDGGHGDEVKTDLDGSPTSFSVGLIHSF